MLRCWSMGAAEESNKGAFVQRSVFPLVSALMQLEETLQFSQLNYTLNRTETKIGPANSK